LERALATGIGGERVPRVRTAYVRADRTLEPLAIVVVVTKQIAVRLRRVVAVGGFDERGTARPAAHHARGQALTGSRVRSAVRSAREGVQRLAKRADVLSELPENEVRAISAEVAPRRALDVEREERERIVLCVDETNIGLQPVHHICNS